MGRLVAVLRVRTLPIWVRARRSHRGAQDLSAQLHGKDTDSTEHLFIAQLNLRRFLYTCITASRSRSTSSSPIAIASLDRDQERSTRPARVGAPSIGMFRGTGGLTC